MNFTEGFFIHENFVADVAGKKLVFYKSKNIKPNIFAAPPAT